MLERIPKGRVRTRRRGGPDQHVYGTPTGGPTHTNVESRVRLAQVRLQFAEDQLNWIEVGRVRGK